MTKDEALRLALETLEYAGPSWIDARQPAITAIKAALANEALDKMAENARELGLDYEPEQKPAAWAKFSAKGNIIDLLNEPDDDYTPLYTTPPQRTWVGLTNAEVNNFVQAVWPREATPTDYIRAIEAKLKDKNETN